VGGKGRGPTSKEGTGSVGEGREREGRRKRGREGAPQELVDTPPMFQILKNTLGSPDDAMLEQTPYPFQPN